MPAAPAPPDSRDESSSWSAYLREKREIRSSNLPESERAQRLKELDARYGKSYEEWTKKNEEETLQRRNRYWEARRKGDQEGQKEFIANTQSELAVQNHKGYWDVAQTAYLKYVKDHPGEPIPPNARDRIFHALLGRNSLSDFYRGNKLRLPEPIEKVINNPDYDEDSRPGHCGRQRQRQPDAPRDVPQGDPPGVARRAEWSNPRRWTGDTKEIKIEGRGHHPTRILTKGPTANRRANRFNIIHQFG